MKEVYTVIWKKGKELHISPNYFTKQYASYLTHSANFHFKKAEHQIKKIKNPSKHKKILDLPPWLNLSVNHLKRIEQDINKLSDLIPAVGSDSAGFNQQEFNEIFS